MQSIVTNLLNIEYQTYTNHSKKKFGIHINESRSTMSVTNNKLAGNFTGECSIITTSDIFDLVTSSPEGQTCCLID